MHQTHYWYRPKTIERGTFRAIVDDFLRVLPILQEEYSIRLGNGAGTLEPIINNNEVVFNGRKDLGEDYESFVFLPVDERPVENSTGKVFSFVKTDNNPYDLAVQVFLVIAKHHLGKEILIQSDAKRHEWWEATELVREQLGYDDFHFGPRP